MYVPPAPPSTHASSEVGEPFSSLSLLGAAVLTLFAPVISLIAALVLMQQERITVRRDQLKTWAIVSGVWLAIGGLFLIIVVASVAGGASSACKGGVDNFQTPSYTTTDGVHWKAQYACLNGGTTSRPAPGYLDGPMP